MTASPAVRDKAASYLAAGRLTVTFADLDRVAARCQGSAPEPYAVSFTVWSGWSCSCPARVRDCAHLTALRLVVDLGALERPDGDQPPRPPPPGSDGGSGT